MNIQDIKKIIMKDSCISICVFVSKIEIRCLWQSITSDKKWKKVIFLFSYLSELNVLAYKFLLKNYKVE